MYLPPRNFLPHSNVFGKCHAETSSDLKVGCARRARRWVASATLSFIHPTILQVKPYAYAYGEWESFAATYEGMHLIPSPLAGMIRDDHVIVRVDSKKKPERHEHEKMGKSSPPPSGQQSLHSNILVLESVAGMAVKPRRIGLTRDGFNGASLHRKAGSPQGQSKEVQAKKDSKIPVQRATSPDILAPPLSSSEEESDSSKRKLPAAFGETNTNDPNARSRKRHATSELVGKQHPPKAKRSTRMTRASPNDDRDTSLVNDQVDPREEEVFNSSQQRRQVRGYRKPASFENKTLGSVASKRDGGFKMPSRVAQKPSRPDDKEADFVVPRGLGVVERKREASPGFISRKVPALDKIQHPDEPDQGFRQKVCKVADPILRSEIQQAMDASGGGFIVRRGTLDNLSVPSSSVETIAEDVFTPGTRQRSGSASSSPLSSLQASPRQDDDDDVGESSVPCPLCGVSVSREFYETYNNGRPLTFSDQHRFCDDHRLETARAGWTKLGYPEICWESFEDSRITKTHIDTLLQILDGTRQSHYSSVLASHASRGPKALQTFFKRGIVDVVSAGYYGPKGSKMMAQVIQDRISKQLNHSATKNELLRDAGVGGYVQSVLVPELTVLLVKEDMNSEDDEKARQIMKESLDIGLLLNGEEEDNIEEDDEDGGNYGNE